MKYFHYTPSPPLRHFVASIWYAENAPAHELEQFLPTGDVDLIVNVRDGELVRYEVGELDNPRLYLGPVVSGAHSRPYVIHTGQQAALLGVKFRMGCARDVVGYPLDALGNTHVALTDIWGRAAHALQEEVMTATTVKERFARVENILTAQLVGGRATHPAIADAVRALTRTIEPSPVTGVAYESSLSARRFIEVFRRDVGLAPKQFSAVVRFHRALRLLSIGRYHSLSALALDTGYYDQAHFTRDFKAMAGMTPTEYRTAKGAYDNQVPLHGVKTIQDTPAARRYVDGHV